MRYRPNCFAQKAPYRCVRRPATIFAQFHEPLVFLDINVVLVSLVTNMAKQTPDHITEIAELLAAGLTRLQAWKSSRKSAEFGESSLHFSPNQSGGVPPYSTEAPHD
jgi:hypothetical protein